jgi:hypothetical protein
MDFGFSKTAKEDVRHRARPDTYECSKVPRFVVQAVPRGFEISTRSGDVLKEDVAFERAARFDVALPHPLFGVLPSRLAHARSFEEPRVAVRVSSEVREDVRPSPVGQMTRRTKIVVVQSSGASEKSLV